MKAKKGEMIELKLDNLAHGGDCVGHLDGLAIFVPEGIPGEKVRVKINERKKSYARGEIVDIISPSPARIEADCQVFNKCGGCQLQHMNYQSQLKAKREVVRDALSRIGKIDDVEVKQVIGPDYPWKYRNKAQFPLGKDKDGKIITGFYQRGSHQLIPHKNCHIQHPLINRIKDITLSLLNEYDLSVYNEKTHQGLLRHLVIRTGICTNQAILTIVTLNDEFPYKKEIAKKLKERIPELKGVMQNINSERTNVILGKETRLISGQDYYLDYIGSIKFAISPRPFFQVNTLQTKKLYDRIKEYADLTGEETVVDAYCGIGSIALYLADRAKVVYGIEEVEKAIENARKNAAMNNIKNCTFTAGKVEDILPEFIGKGIKPDVLVFDPPRKGLAKKVVETVLKTKPIKIVYVSCNPATLARDLSLLKNKYRIKVVQPVDMFPQTYHIETVTLLELIS